MGIKDKIQWRPLPADQYVREASDKNTIYLHHTAGNADPYSVLRWWDETSDPVATAFVIGGKPTRANHSWKDGELIQAFSSKYWAWHLGVKQSNMPPGSLSSKKLNSQAVGIEICNFGYLTQHNGRFVSYANTIIPDNEVVDLGYEWRGHQYWHKYTDNQLSVLGELLVYLGQTYEIPLCYKGDSIFDLDMRAFEGEAGVFTHVSVRKDKTDCYPAPNLIKLLKEVGG